jgi:hypothetical protein
MAAAVAVQSMRLAYRPRRRRCRPPCCCCCWWWCCHCCSSSNTTARHRAMYSLHEFDKTEQRNNAYCEKSLQAMNSSNSNGLGRRCDEWRPTSLLDRRATAWPPPHCTLMTISIIVSRWSFGERERERFMQYDEPDRKREAIESMTSLVCVSTLFDSKQPVNIAGIAPN